MFGWICFEKHDSGCIFRMIYIDKPFKYTLPCPYMILPQVASMAASAWCYHCSSYPGYTQWRFFFQGFLYVYIICFSAIFMIPWIYSAWKSRHWNLEQTKLKVLRISKWGIKHRKITKIPSNTWYLDNLGLPESRSAGVSCSTFDTRYLVPTIPDIATNPRHRPLQILQTHGTRHGSSQCTV